jgi:hypothetical protein
VIFTILRKYTHQLLIWSERFAEVEIEFEIRQSRQVRDTWSKMIVVEPAPTGYTFIVIVQDPLETLDIAED